MQELRGGGSRAAERSGQARMNFDSRNNGVVWPLEFGGVSKSRARQRRAAGRAATAAEANGGGGAAEVERTE